jgi:DNA-binding PadR family transcriptional regulator
MSQRTPNFPPLSTAAMHILLALAGEDLHGYGIMLEAARQSQGQYKLGPGTLYDNLRKLMAQGFVEESGKPRFEDDTRRRYYRLTGLGRRALAEEVARLQKVLRQARSFLQSAKPRRA